ncbi:MAG: hypothetical protein V2J07_10985 [Anaerolineae bacterium]|nr:hypothetical protein [Anaerolineae bacterium]
MSVKIDYLVKTAGNMVVFVELKTDNASRREVQDEYLARAQQVGMINVLEGVRKIYQATKSKKKYNHLLHLLGETGLIALDEKEVFCIPQVDYKIKIIYIQPNNAKKMENVISFHEAAAIIENHDDELSHRFAQSLREWAEVRAGDCYE